MRERERSKSQFHCHRAELRSIHSDNLIQSSHIDQVRHIGSELDFFNYPLNFLSWLVGWLVGFLTSSSTTRLYRGRSQDRASDNFTCCHT